MIELMISTIIMTYNKLSYNVSTVCLIVTKEYQLNKATTIP